MTSQLNVDTIKGKTTAGSITIQGEGSATINLQQGLNKFWMQTRGDLITGNIQDSFNSSTVTDIGTGFIDTNFTNNMNNAFYSMSNIGMNGDHIVNSTDYTLAASCRFAHYNQSNSATDPGIAAYIVAGDLA
jgi:hypothetical protein|tara:strand:- start:37 stop:432 length:396 start_codon:yes stop_codon:yes gene_type:complete